MSFGPYAKFTGTIASGATISSEIDLGRTWKSVYLDPTGASSAVRFQAAASSAGTYRQVYLPQPTTSTVQANIWTVSSAISGGMIQIPPGLRFFKIDTTASVANGLSFTVICSD